jgi:membrane associated rhomboid family serine protease
MSLSITTIIIILTVLASLYAWNRPDIMEKWMMNPYNVAQRKQYYRFVTSGFIHADYMHLIFNMLAFYSFGEIMEQTFRSIYGTLGNVLYVALYLLAIIASDIPTFLKYRNNYHYNSLGASGGVSAIVFAAILFYPQAKMGIMFLPIRMPAFIFGALYMFYSIYMSRRGGDYINHDAHIWGALFGIAFCVVVYPRVVEIFMSQILGGF